MKGIKDSVVAQLRRSFIWNPGKSAYYRVCSLLNRWLTGQNPKTCRLRAAADVKLIVPLMQRMTDRSTRAMSDYHDMLRDSVHLSYPMSRQDSTRLMTQAINTTPIEETSDAMVARALGLGVPLRSSFCASLTLRAKRQETTTLPEWMMNEKDATEAFAHLAGIRHPNVRNRGDRFRNLQLRASTVLKPCHGSAANGVFLVFAEDDIVELSTGTRFTNRKNLVSHVERRLAGGHIRSDEWIVEDLILGSDGNPAHDVKCYAFYGYVAMILEVRRYPELHYRCMDREGRLIESGRHQNTLEGPVDWLFGAIDMAEEISLKVPAPFMRIDLLAGAEELALGEFTPRPGGYAGFTPEVDRRLGKCFAEAETLLFDDLMAGKRFTDYERFLIEPAEEHQEKASA